MELLRRAVHSFHPASMPYLTRALYTRELPAWGLLPVMTGILEGGVVGVIIKKIYTDAVPDDILNLVVALLTGIQAIANVLSFAWAALGNGRHKIRMLLAMQIACAVLVALPALASETPGGLVVFVVGIVGARLCWSGVVTLRSTVWASNYPRAIRARIAGKFATIQALVLAGVSVGIGLLMDHDQHAYRWAYPLAAGVGLLGSLAYSRVRIRGHRALLQQERRVVKKPGSMRPSLNPLNIVRFLRLDRQFRRFMICQFLLGTGNMMITAPLIIILTDHYGMDYLDGIAIITTIPILMMPFSIPLWSRLLDRVHIIRFRAVHSWLFVLSNMVLVFTVANGWLPGLWIAAGIRGIAFGGGVLAWNLGHHDFTNVASSSAYMGVHVSLTGFRGLIAPFLGVVLYESLQGVNPTGWIVFVIALALGIAGAGGFVILSRLLPRDSLDEVR